MAVKIAGGGSRKASSRSKSSTRSTSKSRQSGTQSKRTAQRASGTKRNSSSKAKASNRTRSRAKAEAPKQRGRKVGQFDSATMKKIERFEDRLTAAGERLSEAQEEHSEAVEALYELSQKALDNDVPISVVSRMTGVSRQWLYKMGEHANRNGSGPKRGPGRPKGSGTKSKATKATAKKTGSTVKRGPGRPKGSKNKKSTSRGGSRVRSRR